MKRLGTDSVMFNDLNGPRTRSGGWNVLEHCSIGLNGA